MSYKITMSSGKEYSVPDGVAPEDFLEQETQKQYAAKGVEPDRDLGKVDNANIQTDVLDKMNPVERRMAAVGGGAKKFLRNSMQMMTPESLEKPLGIDDASQANADAIQKPIQDDLPGWSLAGEVAPSMLIPGSTVARGGVAALRAVAPKLAATAAKVAPTAVAAGEGSFSGAALAGSQDRASGAKLGATGGVAGNLLGRGVGRVAARGLVKKSPEALEAAAETGRYVDPNPVSRGVGRGVLTLENSDNAALNKVGEALNKLGITPKLATSPFKEGFVPVAQAGKGQGMISSTLSSAYERLLPALPGAESALTKQLQDLASGVRREAIRRTYGAGKAMQHYDETGNAYDAVRLGEKLRGKSKPDVDRQLLLSLTQKTPKGDFEPGQLAARTRGMEGYTGKFKELGESVESVLAGPSPAAKTNTILWRNVFYGLTALAAGAGGAPGLLGAATLAAVARGLASKGFQKALMGDTAFQKSVTSALKTANGDAAKRLVGKAIRMGMTGYSMDPAYDIDKEEVADKVKQDVSSGVNKLRAMGAKDEQGQ